MYLRLDGGRGRCAERPGRTPNAELGTELRTPNVPDLTGRHHLEILLSIDSRWESRMKWLRRLRYALRQRRHHAELAEELQFHRDLKRLELEANGASSSDADAASRRALGNDALVMNQARDIWLWPWLQDIAQDVRFAVRMLAKDRRFTMAAVVALGLGIGVNNSVFAIIDATLFRDAPFDRGDQLLSVHVVDSRGQGSISLPELRDLQESTRAFQALAASTGAMVNLSDPDKAPERLRGSFVSANTFGLLRTVPALGRDFRAYDDQRGAATGGDHRSRGLDGSLRERSHHHRPRRQGKHHAHDHHWRHAARFSISVHRADVASSVTGAGDGRSASRDTEPQRDRTVE